MRIGKTSQNTCRKVYRIAALLSVAGFGALVSGCGAGSQSPLPSVPIATSESPSGPVLGYVFSPADGTLRAMLGVSGSARMSESIIPAHVYLTGDASTASGTALLADENGSLFAFNLPQSKPQMVVEGLPSNSRVVFSASGKTAITYAPGSASIVLITGLPAAPLTQTVNVPPGRSPQAATVSDTGTIVTASEGSPSVVEVLSGSGQATPLSNVSAFGAMSFVPGSNDILLVDKAANTLAIVRSVTSAPSTQTLSIVGLSQPVAVSASQDGRWAIVANGGDSRVVSIDLTRANTVQSLNCACQPTQLNALAGGKAFRLNSVYGGPVWTIDLTAKAPQMLFVPGIAKNNP